MKNEFSSILKRIIVTLGVLLSLGTAAYAFVAGGFHLADITFSACIALWASTPYIIYGVLTSRGRRNDKRIIKIPESINDRPIIKNPGSIIGAGILMLGLDIYGYMEVFVFPSSSTSAILLLFLPFWLIVLIMPIGFLGGWLVELLIRRLRHI